MFSLKDEEPGGEGGGGTQPGATEEKEESTPGGWDVDADWGSIDELGPSPSKSDSIAGKVAHNDSPWGHPDFAPTASSKGMTSAYAWGEKQNEEDFFTSLIDDNKKVCLQQITCASVAMQTSDVLRL